MRPQTLISISTALILGLTTVIATGTEAAPVKMQATPMKSAAPVKRAIARTARINIVKAVLKPARTKGKLNLKVTLHNSSAAKATAFTVQATHKRRVMGKMNINGLNPRDRITRTLRNLPQQKGQRCVTVRLTKPRNSKLKLGTSRKVCLKSPMAIRGIGTSPGRKIGTRVQTTTRGRPGNTSRIRAKSRAGTKTIKGKTRLGVKYITVNNTLTINGQALTVTVNPGQTVTANWAFPSGLVGNPNQVAIRVHLGNFPNIPNECQTGGGDAINSGAIGGLTGSYTINTASLTVGQTYKVKACLINSGTGNTGDESNVVALKYENVVQKPDLVVTEMYQTGSGEIRFKVKNNGPGIKQPASKIVYYSLRVRTISGPSNRKDFKAIAPLTTLARMTPGTGNEWVQERILDYKTPKYGVHSFKVCINVYHRLKSGSYGRSIEETNHYNNCLTRKSNELNPVDLSIVSGKFHIGSHESYDKCEGYDPHWYRFDFNPCGIDFSYAELTIRNTGTGVAKNFYVALISPQFAVLGGTPSTKVARLNPGESRTIKVYVTDKKYKKNISSCCQLKAVIDVSNVIPEINEGNNEFEITNVRARRTGGRSRGRSDFRDKGKVYRQR